MPQQHSQLVKKHFQDKYYDYDQLIRKLIPRYEEMHKTVVDQVRTISPSPRILDLGIGTGQTALELIRRFPHVKIDGYDISSRMIGLGKERLSEHRKRVRFFEQDIKDLDLGNEIYDACVAVLSVHHLDELQKRSLFKKLACHLKEGRVFVMGDIVKFDSKEMTIEMEEKWRDFLIDNLGEQEGRYWFENYQEEDLPSSSRQQVQWLQEAGFKQVKCVWEFMNYAVISGEVGVGSLPFTKMPKVKT